MGWWGDWYERTTFRARGIEGRYAFLVSVEGMVWARRDDGVVGPFRAVGGAIARDDAGS